MAEEDIGSLAVKIAMNDSSFQQGMQSLKRSMGVIDSGFKESIAGVKDWGNSLDGLKANAQALSDKIEIQKQIVQQYSEQLQKSKDNLQANSEKMMDLKSKVESAKTAWEQSKAALGANDEATLRLKKEYEDLNKQYTDSESKVRSSQKSVEGYTVQVNNASAKLKGMESDLASVSKQLDETAKKQSLFGQITEKLGLNMDNLKTAFGAIGMAAGTFLKGAVDSATLAQQSTQQLTNELKNQGMSAGETSKDIQNFTGAIVKMSDYSAGEAKEALQILTEKGISAGDAIKQESTIANVAAGTNKSLSDAASLVADAYHGKMRALVSLGIVTQQEIKDNTAAQKAEQLQIDIESKIKDKYGETTVAAKLLSDMYKGKTQSLVDSGVATKAEAKTLSDASKTALSMTEIQDRLNKRFGGAAQTDLKSYSGQIKEMQNQFNASKTAIGSALLPILAQLAQSLEKVITPMATFVQQNPQFTAAVLSIVAVVGTLVGGLSAINTFAGIFAPLATAMTGVEVAASSLILPVLGIVAAIAAVSAIVYVVIKNWGPISSFFKNLWQNIKTDAESVWNGIGSFFNNIWNSIKTTSANVWNGIGDFFKNTWNDIKTIAEGVFNGIKQFFISIWSGIAAGTMIIVQPFVNGITNLFDGMMGGLTQIFNGLKTYFTGIWDAIKLIFLGPVLLILDLVTGNFTKFSSDAQKIFEGLKNAFQLIWIGIKEVFTGEINAIAGFVIAALSNAKDNVIAIWNAAGKLISGLWDGIKTTAINSWNSLKNGTINIINDLKVGAINIFNSILDFFRSLPGTLKSLGVNAFNGLKNGISSVINTIGSTVKSGFNSAISFIKGLPNEALQWGKDIINGIVSGIKSAVDAVRNAIQGVAQDIRKFLHFSVPDEGPLADYESWMPDFMKGMAEGIEKSKGVVTSAIKGLSEDMTVEVKSNMISNGTNNNAAKGVKGNTKINSYDSLLRVDKLVIANDMDIQALAEKLEFYRKQANMGLGGA